MNRLLIENYKILKSAIGVEPPMQIFLNGLRKLVGLPPSHKRYSTEALYGNYIKLRNKFLSKNTYAASSEISFTLIWIVNSENKKDLRNSWNDINNQFFPPTKIIAVDRFSLLEDFEIEHVVDNLASAILLTANAEYVAFVNDTDCIHAAFLQEAAHFILDNKSVDIMYTCDDMLDARGKRHAPKFKPQLNIDLLYGSNYIGRNIVVKKKFGEKVNWFDTQYPSSYIYDFLLRSTEKNAKILRIEEVLVSKKENRIKEDLIEKKKALEAHIKRRGMRAKVLDGIEDGSTRLQRTYSKKPVVSIIIPFKDKVFFLRQCIDSILENTNYKNYEIILLDNGSQKEETRKYLSEITSSRLNIYLLTIDRPFNFSSINNEAVKNCIGDYILFLNNDTKVIDKGWLNAMVDELQRQEVGVVGAKLLYEDGTVQHAGVLLGVGHVAGHSFRNLKDSDEGHMQRANTTQEYLAVTGACLMTKKVLFEKVGGFDEENLKVSYNDVDYCLKIHELGYKIIYTPYSKLYHYESKSRAHDLVAEEVERYNGEVNFMRNKWGEKYFVDPFFHPHLDNKSEDFSIGRQGA